jgi:hypothetical protein
VVGVREGWWTGREPGLRDERAGQAVTLETNYPDAGVPRDLMYATTYGSCISTTQATDMEIRAKFCNI